MNGMIRTIHTDTRHRRTLLWLLMLTASMLSACKSTPPRPTEHIGSAEATPMVVRDVYYAGFAYLGQYALVNDNYPHALRLNQKENGVGRLEKALLAQIHTGLPSRFNLRFDLADRRQSVEEFKGTHTKLIAEVSAQLLFFDFGSMTLMANVPVRFAKNHLAGQGADLEAEIRTLYDEIYLGAAGEESVLSLAAHTLRNFDLATHVRDVRVQVKAIRVDAEPLTQLPKSLKTENYTQYLGQYMSARLSEHYSLSVLPYVRGYAIGNKMPGRFANGDIFTLTLPEPDYTFEFSLIRFNRQPIEQLMYYVAYGKLSFRDPSLNVIYIDDDFKQAVQKIVLSEDGLDHWGAYNDAVEELISGLVKQLGNPDDDWFDVHARTASDTYKKFRTKQELFSGVMRK
jgi:hypothetical protein